MAGSAFKLGKVAYTKQDITSSGSTTVLLNNSDKYQYVTGTAAQTIQLPDATTMVNALGFKIVNAGTGIVTIVDSGSNVLTTMGARTSLEVVVDDSSTANGVWMLLGGVGGSNFIVATGGTITTNGNFKVHTFTSSGTFQILSGSGIVDSLVVAGGGGGVGLGTSGGSGGGAGGMIYTSPGASYAIGSYPITVGAGGTGAMGVPDSTSGSNSTFDTVTSLGGGAGGNIAIGGGVGSGSAGGSGGGGTGSNGIFGGAGGAGTSGQGNAGGIGGFDNTVHASGGGGGGKGGIGGNGTITPYVGGAGGLGASNSITGSAVFYASGGGGGGTDTAGTASAGGGGNGGSGAPGSNATPNTGGGGGGGLSSGTNGNGGSGVVILRYQFQ